MALAYLAPTYLRISWPGAALSLARMRTWRDATATNEQQLLPIGPPTGPSFADSHLPVLILTLRIIS
ncbi:unnamed protein product, partial [Nesidiocoris tenuis]